MRARMSPEAHEGLVSANLSSLFTLAVHEPEVRSANRDTVQQMIGLLQHTQIGRLQLTAFLMLDLERAGTPPEQWWATLEPLLAGLEQTTFSHYLHELIEHRTRIFESKPIGLGPGSARAYAEQTLGHPHGPFLQFFVDRLRRVAQARRTEDDGSAEICRRITRRLLRQWVLDPGPVGLRLLAADLLADNLEALGTTTPMNHGELARRLRAWRAAYRNQAANRPMPIPPLSLRWSPEPCPEEYQGALRSLSLLVWTAAATLAAALLTVVCLPLGFSAALRLPLRWWHLAGVLATGLVILGAWLAWSVLWPRDVADDLHRFASDGLAWPRQPFAAGAVTLALLGLWALPAAGSTGLRRARLARLALVAAFTWFVLSLALIGVRAYASVNLAEYELSTAPALLPDEYAAMAGAEADKLLDGVRVWTP